MNHRGLAQIFLIGFALGAALTARRTNRQMSTLHDDLLAKVEALKTKAQNAQAKLTNTQQSFTDVSTRLDEVSKILDEMLADDASEGGSTGGKEAKSVSQQTDLSQQGQNTKPASGQQQQQQTGQQQRGSEPSQPQPGASSGPTSGSGGQKTEPWRAR